jgi:hypothetical protein
MVWTRDAFPSYMQSSQLHRPEVCHDFADAVAAAEAKAQGDGNGTGTMMAVWQAIRYAGSYRARARTHVAQGRRGSPRQPMAKP